MEGKTTIIENHLCAICLWTKSCKYKESVKLHFFLSIPNYIMRDVVEDVKLQIKCKYFVGFSEINDIVNNLKENEFCTQLKEKLCEDPITKEILEKDV